ncbi:MAG: hypothetical protein R3C05_06725 [Pirellulaceae bacterium]
MVADDGGGNLIDSIVKDAAKPALRGTLFHDQMSVFCVGIRGIAGCVAFHALQNARKECEAIRNHEAGDASADAASVSLGCIWLLSLRLVRLGYVARCQACMPWQGA